MTAPTPLDIVNAFLDAIEARDFDRAAAYLSSNGFSYQGPIDCFESADAFIKDISSVGTILERIERRRMFVDGDEVCAILTYETTIDELESTRIAHWIRVSDGHISRIESFFDVRAYARMFDPER